MGYTFTWKDIEKICRKLGMEKQGSVWTGIGSDGKLRTTHKQREPIAYVEILWYYLNIHKQHKFTNEDSD